MLKKFNQNHLLNIMKQFTSLILLFSVICFAQNKSYSIKGTIKNAASDYLYIIGEDFIDSTKIKDEKFEFKGQFDHPKKISLSTKNTRRSDGIYLENSDYEIDLEVSPGDKSMSIIHLTGKSKTQNLKNEFVSFYESNYDQKDFGRKVYNKLDTLISTYPKNPLIGEMLAAIVEQGGIISSFEASNLLDKLDLKFQNKSSINDIKVNIKKYEKFEIGSKLPTIILPNENNKMVDISKSNAELTFIEFWFVGCTPCMEAIPKLKEVYKKFNTENVEIIFIAIQENKESWKNALEKFDMPWQNLICVDKTSNKTIQSLQIQFYPSSFLVDKNNQILGVNLEPIQLKNRLKELLAEKS